MVRSALVVLLTTSFHLAMDQHIDAQVDYVNRYLTVVQILQCLGDHGVNFSLRVRRNKMRLLAAAFQAGHGRILLDAIHAHRAAQSTSASTTFESISSGSSTRSQGDAGRFMELPTEEEEKELYQAFYDATSNTALKFGVCAVCTQLRRIEEAAIQHIPLSNLPNRHLLISSGRHPADDTVQGYLLLPEACSGGDDPDVAVCTECIRQLTIPNRMKPPKLSLANKLWIGQVPLVLRRLHLTEQLLIALLYPRVFVVKLYPKTAKPGDPELLQSALRGNVTTYPLNIERIADMISGNLMPQPLSVLPQVLSITYVGSKGLSNNRLRSTFGVRRYCVADALQWMKQHNRKYYSAIVIDQERLRLLPEDDVPEEVMAVIRQTDDPDIAAKESATYVPDDTNDDESFGDDSDDANVIPMRSLGIIDTDLTELSTSDVSLKGLVNLWKEGKEGGYLVRYGNHPASDFRPREEDDVPLDHNFWEKAFPTLFPYGEGGLERDRPTDVPFMQHVHWLLHYHDRRFRTHPNFAFTVCSVQQRRQALSSARIAMKRRDFDVDSQLFHELKGDELERAAKEEEEGRPILNPIVKRFKQRVYGTASRVFGTDASRLQLRSQVWSTSICFGPATAWLTINPDESDPIAQVFIGEEIDLDAFVKTAGPDSQQRTRNIAHDGCAGAMFFDFIITTLLETLFGIRATRSRVHSEKGIFGHVKSYFGCVETQGRGTLHLHLLIWLEGSPSVGEWKQKLREPEFREKLRTFIRRNCRAFHPRLATPDQIASMVPEKEIGYNRPPNPHSPNYTAEADDLYVRVMRTKQVHVCTQTACLRYDRNGVERCKRHAPWPLSEEDVIFESGEWLPKRTYAYFNPHCPGISICLLCNNDSKLLTNAEDTQASTHYFTTYMTKKQERSYNASALLAKGLAFHRERDQYFDDLRNSNRLLLFRCANILNTEQELAAQLVFRYLLGKSETVRSHTYSPLQWGSFYNALVTEFPELKSSQIHTLLGRQPGPIVQDQDTGEPVDSEVLRFALSEADTLIIDSAVNDYRYRSEQLAAYSVLDYAWDTYEIPVNDDELPPQSDTRFHYLPVHSKYRTAMRVVRHTNHNHLPNFTGRFIPRSDDADQKELYSASILMLMCPWRNIRELKTNGGSWAQSLSDFMSVAPRPIHAIVDNLQHFYSCSDAVRRSQTKERLTKTDLTVLRQHGELGAHSSEDNNFSLLLDEDEDESIDIEELIKVAKRKQMREADRIHGQQAVLIGEIAGFFSQNSAQWTPSGRVAMGDDMRKLTVWKQAMSTAHQEPVHTVNHLLQPSSNATVEQLTDAALQPNILPDVEMAENALPPVDVTDLNTQQRLVYDIVTTHLDQHLAGDHPQQLCLIVYGEGGTGKSRVIQTITQYFKSRGQEHTLVKCAFTGVAASLINGKTYHSVFHISIRGGPLSDASRTALESELKEAGYIVIDEISMISSPMFAKGSRHGGGAKHGDFERFEATRPFGGLNVIILGDFHQFPPIGHVRKGLLWKQLSHTTETSSDETNGRILYEQFNRAVTLHEQKRIRDPEWHELLTHLRIGRIQPRHIRMLRSLIITHPDCPPTDFSKSPWNQAKLVTPRHAVRVQWNEAAVAKHCAQTGVQQFISVAKDSINGRPLTNFERLLVARKKGSHHGNSSKEGTKLPDEVRLAKGMKVMVTLNIHTDIDITNGARGEVVDIILQPEESASLDAQTVILSTPPAYVLVRLERTRLPALPGLEPSVIPIEPVSMKFPIQVGDAAQPNENVHTRTVTRNQLPMTEAYAFTDICAQGQSIDYVIVDISRPPSGRLTLFNIYVALSRSSGRDTIRLLRDFDERPFLEPLDPDLLREDDRIEELSEETVRWWNMVKSK
ncbi:hypothetical protein NM688_g415 [Phlebia brevispora]|uniref:Uncharacterized protein n=1 Tax=Phlebia brevispora TaxID=194682 RepID=A0ACC1TED7_9APHY|nr:hypothetical protein NM688_g415 [Phlebia brevispora]